MGQSSQVSSTLAAGEKLVTQWKVGENSGCCRGGKSPSNFHPNLLREPQKAQSLRRSEAPTWVPRKGHVIEGQGNCSQPLVGNTWSLSLSSKNESVQGEERSWTAERS